MKFFFLLILFYSGRLLAQSSIYNVSIESINGKTILLSEFRGEKIVIATVSPDRLKNGGLSYLDSLQIAYPSVTILVVPADDFGGLNDSLIITDIKKNISSLHVTIAAECAVKKDKGFRQNPLLKWLTNVAANSHFNDDVETDDQLFIISESGILYAVLVNEFSGSVIKNVLSQPDVKQ